ncbi:hypothetical protein [Colwellia piezophila]|uniref:hypothetical protein n=1 Tax=Colwellia piezophila TaxID=211668 RepID=UPI00037C57BE|nr:hypothetical protein [Colwellia piezophila]
MKALKVIGLGLVIAVGVFGGMQLHTNYQQKKQLLLDMKTQVMHTEHANKARCIGAKITLKTAKDLLELIPESSKAAAHLAEVKLKVSQMGCK